MSSSSDNLLELRNMKKYFPVEKSIIERILGSSTEAVHAVDNITLEIRENEIFGLCGESGCGKSTTARVISGLDFETGGDFIWKGEIKSIAERKKFSFRKKIQLIFQNPFTSLHPRMSIGSQVAHALEIQLDHPKREEYVNFARKGKWVSFFIFLASFISLIMGNTYELVQAITISKSAFEYIGYNGFQLSIASFFLLNYLPKQILFYKIIRRMENRAKASMLLISDIGAKIFGTSIIIAIYFIILGIEPTHFLGLNLIIKYYAIVYPGITLQYIGSLVLIFGGIFYLRLNYITKRRYLDRDVIELFKAVGLTPAPDFYLKYPHHLSGGERQRVAIARALILNPNLIIADEPTSMLDVSIRASILDLMADLKKRFHLSVLFITHDLATVRYFCDKVAIMYVGEIVETGMIKELFQSPRHPYTWSLIQAIPVPDPNFERKGQLPVGEVPDAISPPAGCRFHPRCLFAQDKCSQEVPTLQKVSEDQSVACHFQEKLFNDQSLKI